MKIIYKQPSESQFCVLNHYGISNCYFKKITYNADYSNITKKSHHHTGYEIHIVIEGYQEYEVDGKKFILKNGDFLLIPPRISHTFNASSSHMLKYAFTFDKTSEGFPFLFSGKITERITNNLKFISDEMLMQKEISSALIENTILEILVLLFRLSGIKENEGKIIQDENAIISLAKQYIDDNIEMPINVASVSEYIHLSTKQLTRIFCKFEETSPGCYITNKRIKKIEVLLSDDTLSLKQISEKLNFSSEYYFNTFFTKNYGMSPGKYRKMLGK